MSIHKDSHVHILCIVTLLMGIMLISNKKKILSSMYHQFSSVGQWLKQRITEQRMWISISGTSLMIFIIID